MSTFSVIVAGAGNSSRFGGTENKILLPLGDRPVFIHSIEAFASRDDVKEIVFVCSPADRELIETRWHDTLIKLKTSLATGGEQRTDSVRNGLAQLNCDTKYIAVHDAARPCISQKQIDTIFEMATRTGAAIPAIPVTGTIKRVSSTSVVTETLDRGSYIDIREVQTPQVFNKTILIDSYKNNVNATDDAAVVEAGGHPVTVVAGDRRNVKITTPEDMEFAKSVIDNINTQ